MFKVAPDQRREKVASQIPQPTSARQTPPLPQDLPPPLPSCGGGVEQIRSANLRREFPEMKVFSPKI